MRIAINGFGRIGRTILRQILTLPRHSGIDIACVNDIAPLDTCAYLFQYDSTFGPFAGDVRTQAGAICVNDRVIPFHHASDLARIDLRDVDVVLECTGSARTSDVARRGLQAGARSVLISGPSPAADVTVVMGANEADLRDARIVSNASCTTNALAPLVRVINQIAGVQRAHMTTIHCYTNSQPMVDAPRGDLARSRGGAQSMVATTTSATELIGQILPQFQGRISGAAVRVPVASVSAIDLVVQMATQMDQATFGAALKRQVSGSQVLGWTDQPLVSSDLRTRAESLVIAGPEIQVTDNRQVRVFGWYDNEWGFSARMLDIAGNMARR